MTIKEKRTPFKPKPLNHKGKSPEGPVQNASEGHFTQEKGPALAEPALPESRPEGDLTCPRLRLLVLLLGPAERRAENVAQAGARVGRAEVGHRLLLLVELTRLDRQHHPARGPVDVGDLGVELVADGVAVGTLLGAVAGKLRLADEARDAVLHRDVDAVVLDAGHDDGDHVALLGDRAHLLERIVGQLLDAERDALLVHVDVEDLDLDLVALLVVADRLVAGLVPRQVAQMHHAVDVAGQADEQAELGDVADLALELGAARVLLGEALPRIGHALLEAERDAALGHVDVQHHHFDLLRGRHDLARMDVLLGPAHLGDVHQTFDARLQLHEGAVVGDVGDAALELQPDRVLGTRAVPRIAHQLLHAERDALRLGVEADDLHLDLLADGEGFRRMVDALPGDVGDMQEAVDAAQIHERAVVGDVLDHAVEHLALGQRAHQAGAVLGAGLFHDGAARHDDVAAAAVHLEDGELLGLAHQRADVAHGRTSTWLPGRKATAPERSTVKPPFTRPKIVPMTRS